MANVQFQSSSPATPSSATIVETFDTGGGVLRQVVRVGDFVGAVAVSSGTITLSSNPTVIPSSNVNVVIVGIPSVSISSGTVSLPPSNTGTVTSISATSSGSTLLSSNASRLGGTVFNDSVQTLYLRLSSTSALASSAAYTAQIVSNAYYELPFNYVGALTASWTTSSGAARVTELS